MRGGRTKRPNPDNCWMCPRGHGGRGPSRLPHWQEVQVKHAL